MPQRFHPQARALFSGLALLLLAAACAQRPADRAVPPVSDPPAVLAAVPIPFYRPADIETLRTTDAEIYLGNLDSRIDALESRLSSGASPPDRIALAAALLHRHEIVGAPEDLIRARLVLEPDAGQRPEALLLRARINSRLHRFEAAQGDLEQAAALGADPARVEPVRFEIESAIAPVPPPARETSDLPTLTALAMEGIRLLDEGRPAEATRKFAQAQGVYQDVNPLPLAWLHVQQGIVYLRYGRLQPARAFFAAAHRRLPRYYLATEHLAETEAALGRHARAAVLYRQVAEQTGNPVFYAALADAESALGRQQPARVALEAAQRGFETALAETPEATWAEAAAFARSQGDLQRAYQHARRNLGIRRDAGSRILMAEIAADLGKIDEACGNLVQATATGLDPPELQLLRERIGGRC